MKRRSFLRLSLWGGGVAAAGLAGLQLWPSDLRHQPRRPLHFLDAGKFSVLAAVAARVVTIPGRDPIEIAHRVEEMMLPSPPEVQAELGQALGLLESAAAGLVFDGRPKPFTRLDPDGQDRALYAWRDSRLAQRRAGFQVLRKLCLGACYAQESTWAATGYPGPPKLQLPADYVVAQ